MSKTDDQGQSGPDRLPQAYVPAMDTLAIRHGIERTAFGEHSEPIFATSSFVFESASQAAEMFSGKAEGYIYSRFSNPGVDSFERRLAAMEQGAACVATASGMSAIFALVMTLLKQGDHIVAARGMFGSTVTLFEKLLPRFGVSVTLVEGVSLEHWETAMQPNTRLVFIETPTNPLTQVLDISALAMLAEANQAWLAVDNCFCTPALQRPLTLGAHVVIHSATKFLDGQGRCVGGAVVMRDDAIRDEMIGFMRSAGPSMSPFNAWVFNKGLETLSLRMQRHCDNAEKLAAWLHEHAAVERVYFPGLENHPQHELARQQQERFGAIVSFDLKDRNAAWQLIDNTRLLSITANLGDAKTTITHPATTTHGRLSSEARAAAGIGEGLVRIALGLESIDDIIADIDHGLRPNV